MLWLLGEHGLNLIVALAAVTGMWGIGRTCWRLLLRSLPEDNLTYIYQFALGAWLTWMSFFVLGLAGGYQPPWARLYLGITTILGGWQLYALRARMRAWVAGWSVRAPVYEQALVVVCALIIVLGIIGALTPPAAQDALVHHLSFPKNLIKAGRLVEFPYDYFSYFPGGMELLFLYGMLVHSANVATLLHLTFGVATFLALLAGGRLLGMSRRARLIAGSAYLTIPTVWMEMTWAYIDLGLTFFVTLTMLALLRYRSEGRTEWLWMSGFALGSALSVKYTALFIVLILPLLILIMLREQQQTSPRQVWSGLFVPMLIALLCSGVWFARNIIFTGNPLFPFFLNLIPSHNVGWDAERGQLIMYGLARYGGEDKTWIDYLLTFFKISLLARYGSFQYYDGVIGQFYLFTLPLLALARKVRIEVKYLLGFAITFYLFWVVSSQQIRYLLPALPALAMAISAADGWLVTKSEDSNGGRWRPVHRIVLALVMAIFLFNTGTIVRYFSEFKYGSLFVGAIKKEDYLREKYDYYQFYEYINSQTPADSRIFLVCMSNQPYYLDRQYFGDAVFEDYTLVKIVKSSQDVAEIKSKIKALGVTHILYRPYILLNKNLTNFSQEDVDKFSSFLREYCQRIIVNRHFTDRSGLVELYVIKS